jgi:predicted nucleic acid-binding protein
MSRYVLDTNIVSLYLRRDSHVLTRLQQTYAADESILGCPVVWYEVRRGLIATDARKRMERFEKLFGTFIWDDYTREDWALAATLWRHAARRADRLTTPICSSVFLPATAKQRWSQTTRKILRAWD